MVKTRFRLGLKKQGYCHGKDLETFMSRLPLEAHEDSDEHQDFLGPKQIRHKRCSEVHLRRYGLSHNLKRRQSKQTLCLRPTPTPTACATLPVGSKHLSRLAGALAVDRCLPVLAGVTLVSSPLPRNVCFRAGVIVLDNF
jgi:hypothetical protein